MGYSPLGMLEMQLLGKAEKLGPDAVLQWIDDHAMTGRKRDQRALETLAWFAARRVRQDRGDQPEPKYYSLEVIDGIPPAALFAGQIVVATLNGDEATVSTMSAAWLEWPAPERAQVILELYARTPAAP
jgi:hypothetical protein